MIWTILAILAIVVVLFASVAYLTATYFMLGAVDGFLLSVEQSESDDQ